LQSAAAVVPHLPQDNLLNSQAENALTGPTREQLQINEKESVRTQMPEMIVKSIMFHKSCKHRKDKRN
jgi:hypothetical protein